MLAGIQSLAIGAGLAGAERGVEVIAEGAQQLVQHFKGRHEMGGGLEILQNEIKVPTGFLAGKTVNDLFAFYLGFDGRTVVPDVVIISPAANIKKLWKRKLDRRAGVTITAQQAASLAESKYYPGAQVEKLSFNEYVKNIDTHLSGLRANIDFENFGNSLGLDKEEVDAMKVAAEEIGGREIVAYSMTELLPGDNGEYNAKFLDLLVKNYGAEYLHWLPALYDEYTSFGPYQFTQFALFDANGRQEGASKVNRFVNEGKYKIPGSVINLEGRAHDRAAYMFALFNIAMLIKETETSEQLQRLIEVFQKEKDILVGMIACMHNLPVTKFAFIEWIKAGASGRPAPKNVTYLKKSINNYRYLRSNSQIDYRTKLSNTSG